MTVMPAPPLVQPSYAHIPECAYTDGDQVCGMWEEAGYGPEPEQRLALNGIFAKDRFGKSVAREIWLVAGRRNLKTAVAKMAVGGWAFLYKADPIIWTAHEWKPTISEVALELEQLISGYRWMARQVRYWHRGERQQEIGLRNGNRILFKTRTMAGARGIDGEKVVLDEGWAIKPAHVGALIPAMGARSITGDPQVIGGSSGAREDSEYLHSVIARGRAAATDETVAALEPSLVYIEYCCPSPEQACDRGERCDHAKGTPGCGCDKPDIIRAGNPAIGRRVSMEFVAWERRTLPVPEFCRERMTWHEKQPDEAKVIPVLAWASAEDQLSEPDGAVMLSVVYSNDKRAANIGLAGRRADQLWHVELADQVSPAEVPVRVRTMIARAAGTGRPVAEPVGIDGHSFEAECIAGLETTLTAAEAGVTDPALAAAWPETVQVRKLTAGDVCAAFSGFFKSVTVARDLRHRGQDELLLALIGAQSRMVGDAGEAWSRKKSGADIAPLVATTNARWLHEVEQPVVDLEPGAWAL